MPERVYITYENSPYGKISGVYRDLAYAISESQKRGDLSNINYQDIIEVPHDGLLDYGVSIAFYYNYSDDDNVLNELLNPFGHFSYCSSLEEFEHFLLYGFSEEIMIVREDSVLANRIFLINKFISNLEKLKKKVIVIADMVNTVENGNIWQPKNVSSELINNTKTVFTLNTDPIKESYILLQHPMKQFGTTPVLTKESLTDSAAFKELLEKGEESNE